MNTYKDLLIEFQDQAIRMLRDEEKHLKWLKGYQRATKTRLFKFMEFFNLFSRRSYAAWIDKRMTEQDKRVEEWKNRCDRWLSADLEVSTEEQYELLQNWTNELVITINMRTLA